MKKEVTVSWAGKMTFIGEAASGNTLTMDAGKANGGLGLGHSPMDLLLMGAGGCASIDVVMILQKGRQELVDCVCQVSGTRAEEMPKVYTDIHMHFVVSGKDLKEASVKRAVELSMTKYCSASLTLAKAAKLTYDWEVKEA
ncbi:OsmC family protein [Emcibacter sp.]|uniref:OsmC family protein n=1 Tax=Emcibacter sp. TaxID=1979954 RepID=UPI002AA681EB|nr:OsmC family protein [Emcibacter sp.]